MVWISPESQYFRLSRCAKWRSGLQHRVRKIVLPQLNAFYGTHWRICRCGERAEHNPCGIPAGLRQGRFSLQSRKTSRESRDCAVMPRELENMGVHSLITFDAHDPRMHNTVPLMSMENVSPALFLRIFPKTSKTARTGGFNVCIRVFRISDVRAADSGCAAVRAHGPSKARRTHTSLPGSAAESSARRLRLP